MRAAGAAPTWIRAPFKRYVDEADSVDADALLRAAAGRQA
jgi:hypothetical protein